MIELAVRIYFTIMTMMLFLFFAFGAILLCDAKEKWRKIAKKGMGISINICAAQVLIFIFCFAVYGLWS